MARTRVSFLCHNNLGLSLFLCLCALVVSCKETNSDRDTESGLKQPGTLLNISGLAWVEDDLFLGVHDTKNTAEKHDWPRASLIRLPHSELEGVRLETLELEFPGERGGDLESISKIPDDGFLLCESGQEGTTPPRIFHLVWRGDTLEIDSHVSWPVPIKNVEATEVFQVGDQLFFLYAERADSQTSTKLRWAPFSTDPLKFGAFQEVPYRCEDPTGKGVRPIVALDVDSNGDLYTVAAYDTGADDGGYRSVVWLIGTMDETGTVQIDANPRRQGVLDGLKVESLAIRERDDGTKQIFLGTDDEHYGGIIRWIKMRPLEPTQATQTDHVEASSEDR